MGFARESDLVSVLLGDISKQFLSKFDYFAKELPVGSRWVDLAFAILRDNNQQVSWELEDFSKFQRAFRALSMVELRYLSFLIGNRGVSIHKMMDAFLLSSNEIRERFLDKFLDSGLVERSSRYTYKATNWVLLEPEKIIAVEAKLSNWNEALMQALDYRIFADYCYVALDGEHWKDKHRFIFKMRGIGLILVFENEVKVELEPRRLALGGCNMETQFQRLRVIRDMLLGHSNKWKPVHKIWG